MHFISLSLSSSPIIIIIYLFFRPLPLVSAIPQKATPTVEKPRPLKPDGNQSNKVEPAKLFGWDRGLDAPSSDKNHPYLVAQEFVTAHNWIRKQYKQPLYRWDEKLASFARQYAMQRYDDCKMIHSDGSYGENLFWGKSRRWTASDVVYSWYTEKEWYDFKTLKCSAPKDQDCGHFTQIVWRDSVRVGCAIQHCRSLKAGMLVVCEYEPPGNFENENPLDNNNAKFDTP